ncbi:MAG: CheR family methyltransferase [Ilumatobacteraceae bacterium]
MSSATIPADTRIAPALGPGAFEYVRALVLERAAIVLDAGKTYLVESRLAPVARKEGLANVNALVDRMRATGDRRLQQAVVESMTTNETSWFRDHAPFDTLREHVLPKLVTARQAERRLEIWSAACSTGQEPYSIAMTLADHFPQLEPWSVRILASDLAGSVLDQARSGRFSQMEVNRGLPAAMLVKHFERNGTHWVVRDDIRRRVQFGTVNLADTWPALPPLDVIFLRNVMIYFDNDTKKAILAKVRRALRPDGFLFLGTAETTLHLDDHFERVQLGGATCYRLLGR